MFTSITNHPLVQHKYQPHVEEGPGQQPVGSPGGLLRFMTETHQTSAVGKEHLQSIPAALLSSGHREQYSVAGSPSRSLPSSSGPSNPPSVPGRASAPINTEESQLSCLLCRGHQQSCGPTGRACSTAGRWTLCSPKPTSC